MEEALPSSASSVKNASHHAHHCDDGLLASDDGGSDDPPPVRVHDENLATFSLYTDKCSRYRTRARPAMGPNP